MFPAGTSVSPYRSLMAPTTIRLQTVRAGHRIARRARNGDVVLRLSHRTPGLLSHLTPSAPRPVTLDFTYVTECVVNEGLRLLLGGPLRDPWPCPYLERPARKPEELAYSEDGLFLHPAHTIDSVYECTLASGCGMECKNRLVQHGPKYRLEVIRCLQRDGRFAKGWGVRSPDFIPRGSFINECVPTPDRAAFITSCRRLAASPPPPSYMYLFLSLPCCPPRCASIGTSESTFLTTRPRAAVSDTTTRR